MVGATRSFSGGADLSTRRVTMNARNVSRSWRAPLVPALVVLLQLGGPAVARAEGDADAAETAAARALAIEGVKLAQADQCSEAVDKLERAEKLKHSPIILRHLGECQVKLGRWVEGSESLRKLLREPLPENASPTVTQAYESASATLREVKPRIPTMKIVLTAPADADFTVKVDGKEVADSVVGVALPTDPGEHEVQASAPGFLKAVSTVKLTASASAFVTLELKRDPSAPAHAAPAVATAAAVKQPASAPPARTEHAPAQVQGTSAGKVLGYVSYTVAAAGLGVGIAFGQSAMHDEKELRDSCPNRVCSEQDKDTLEFAKTKGTISTVGFVVAGAGVTLGTILLFTSGSSSHAQTGRNVTPRTPSQGVRARAEVGLGRIALTGEF
jgi:hypothetical protein